MKVFVAGATGAIGRQLVPRLVEAGHEVYGMTRRESNRPLLEELGAVPVLADALDAAQVADAVGRAQPDVIVHQLTAIGEVDTRHMERCFEATNRLRTEGTDHLLSAGQAIGVRRFVAQSNIAAYGRVGGPVKTEEDADDRAPTAGMRPGLVAIQHLERAVLGASWTEGIVLRYGWFYGPGTAMARGAEQAELVRKRKFPLVADGGAVFSWIHVADAAAATVAAIERGVRGTYNVVDDDPATVAEWLPELAREARREAAATGAALRRAPLRGRDRRGDDDRAARRLQREGQARAGLEPGPPELAQRAGGGMTSREELLDELRPASFAIAYRMLGSVSEAEDLVQEALVRVHQALEAGETIASPPAFVATVTTRLAINELRSARARRERYVGEWLPEPLLTDGRDDPAAHAETADSLSLAMLVLLESLSPEQRAVLLLHDVFDYSYAEVAQIVGKSEENVRQLASRARRHVEAGRPRFRTTEEHRDELARRFLAAAEQGDLAGLEAVLAADVQLTGDGGGKVPSLARTLHGRSRVARTLNTWVSQFTRVPGTSIRGTAVNGAPGVLMLDGQGRLFSVWAFDIAGEEIVGIDAIVNPDKLRHLGPVADFDQLRRAAQ